MSALYLFLIGSFTTLLCAIFVYVSIHEMRRLNPGPGPQAADRKNASS